jgi:hypothetical protein
MKKKNKKNPKLVVIEWVDSGTVSGWAGLEEVSSDPCRCITVGWLIHNRKKAKTVAASLTHSHACGIMTIPTSAITKIRKLK